MTLFFCVNWADSKLLTGSGVFECRQPLNKINVNALENRESNMCSVRNNQ